MRQHLARFIHVATGSQPLPFVYLIPLLLLSVALQLQFSFFKSDGYLGLRLNAADLLLPIIGIIILIRLWLKKESLPRWRIPHMYAGLAALTVLMTVALLNGHHTTEVWNSWAIINKYIGWFVLLAYLGLGGWIGGRPLLEYYQPMLTGFLGFWVFTLVFIMGRLIMIDLQGNSHQILLNYPLAGFMGNRNAYAFLTFSMLAVLTAWQSRQSTKPLWGFYVVWALIPLFYAYNASRAGLVVLVFIVLTFALINFKFALRRVIAPLVIGIIGTLIFFSSFDSYALKITHINIESSRQLMMLEGFSSQDADEKLQYVGDKVRKDTYGDALELWWQHPVIGGGLGSFRDYQTSKRGSYSDVIDCTGLWLLAETGLLGLGLFSAFFLIALWKIFSKIRAGEDKTGFYLGIFLMMMVFAIMSLVHELLYTRFLWFFMGLALSLPSAHSKTHPGE